MVADGFAPWTNVIHTCRHYLPHFRLLPLFHRLAHRV
jgi:hypothetical protein